MSFNTQNVYISSNYKKTPNKPVITHPVLPEHFDSQNPQNINVSSFHLLK